MFADAKNNFHLYRLIMITLNTMIRKIKCFETFLKIIYIFIKNTLLIFLASLHKL